MTNIQEPKSMTECVYFTNRIVGNGKLKAWVFREMCTQCKKGLMGKPVNPKTKKPKRTAKEYVCPECKFTVPEKEYENQLKLNVKYTCPSCNAQDEIQVPYLRKRILRFDEEKKKKVAIESVRFQCSKCSGNIDVTKKLK